jgi:hypothetical protein
MSHNPSSTFSPNGSEPGRHSEPEVVTRATRRTFSATYKLGIVEEADQCAERGQIGDGYPQAWTEFTITLDSVGTTPVDGRIGFRYFVTDGGPAGSNSNYIGIDTVTFTDTAQVTSIDFTKTVGTDPSECATTDSITVPAGGGGTEVTYCYWMDNTGDTTVIYHTVVDDQLGTLLGPGFMDPVLPGESAYFTETVVITQTTVNTATWTITDQAGAVVAEDSDSATVTQLPPTGVSLSSFGVEKSAALLPLWIAALFVAVIGAGLLIRRRVTDKV